MNSNRQHRRHQGIAVDATGGPAIDPTENVKALSLAQAERQDDIRILQSHYIEEIGRLRDDFNTRLSALQQEKDRALHDAQSDALKALANNMESMRQQLASAAATQALRISALEKGASEATGRQVVSDPMFKAMIEGFDRLREGASSAGGRKEGMSDGLKMLVAAVTLAVGLITLGAFVFLGRAPVQQPVAPVYYVPSQPGTLIPSQTQQPQR